MPRQLRAELGFKQANFRHVFAYLRHCSAYRRAGGLVMLRGETAFTLAPMMRPQAAPLPASTLRRDANARHGLCVAMSGYGRRQCLPLQYRTHTTTRSGASFILKALAELTFRAFIISRQAELAAMPLLRPRLAPSRRRRRGRHHPRLAAGPLPLASRPKDMTWPPWLAARWLSAPHRRLFQAQHMPPRHT